MRRSSLLSISIAGLVVLAASGARAQETDDEGHLSARETEARSIFMAGQAAFEDARYEDALRYFRDAYRISQRPGLLYNIGVAADRLRRDREALEAFEQFLRDSPPDTRQRPDAEARVRVLREALAREEHAPPPDASEDTTADETITTAPTTTPTTTTSGGDSTPGWIVLGAGAAVAIAGAVMLAVGQTDADSVANATEGTPWTDVADAAGRADVLRDVGWVLLGVGVAAAVGGVVIAVVAGGSSSSAQARLELLPTGARLSGSF